MIRTSSKFRSGTRRNKHFAKTGGKDATKTRLKDLDGYALRVATRRTIDHDFRSKPNHAARVHMTVAAPIVLSKPKDVVGDHTHVHTNED